MKKWIALMLILALAALTAAGFAEGGESVSERFCGVWQDPYYGRAMLTIMQEGEAYSAVLRWGGSADSEGVWRMEACYDEAADALVYENGRLDYLTYDENGNVTEDDEQWTDAEGGFRLSDGKLLWTDSREDRAAEFAFEPQPKMAPDAQELAERYFLPVAEWQPGTAGSSLRLASLAADLLSFADEYRLWNADVPALRQNLLDAWLTLDETTRGRFDEDLPAVSELIAEAAADYAAVSGQFEDAGAARMAVFAGDAASMRSWETLLAHTYTMGNDD